MSCEQAQGVTGQNHPEPSRTVHPVSASIESMLAWPKQVVGAVAAMEPGLLRPTGTV